MILYTSNQSAETKIVIGGSSAIPGTTAGGVVGPMPRYSINRENLSTGDGTFMGTKFTINVTGTAVIQSVDDGQDITIKGQRQSRVMGEGLTLMQVLREEFPNQGTGKLEISPYGGLSNIMVFNDAKLLNVDLPEQNEESAGVQTLEYSFTFEAYEEDSNNTNTGTTGRPVKPSYKLSSVDESWELSEADGFFYDFDIPTDENNTLRKTYTLSHTVSATGLKKYERPGVIATDGEAFRQAVLWVKTRLVSDPRVEIIEDLMGDETFFKSKFLPIEMNMPGKTDDLGFNLKEGTAANSVDIIGRIISQENFESTHSLEFNFEGGASAEGSTVTATATFQGLSTLTSDNTKIDKYAGALKAFNIVKPLIPTLAEKAYKDSQGQFALRTDINSSESVGHNKVSGTVTYSVSFNDYELPKIANAVSENVTISYNNDRGEQKLIAILQVIGRAGGPIVQDIQTTQIRSRTIAVDAVMKRGSGKPDGESAISSYRPTTTSYLTSSTESWNPNTRAYNKSETWEFNGDT